MKTQKHICFFPGALKLGGVGKLTLNIAAEMVKRDIKVDFFLSDAVGDYIDKIHPEINVFVGNGSVRSSMLKFVTYLKEEQPFAVISARDYINIANIIGCKISKTTTRSITSVHVDYRAIPREMGFFRSKFISLFGKKIYPYASGIIAVSNGVAENHSERMNISRDDITVIYNPVYNSEEIELATGTRTHPWLDSKKVPVIIGVGRFTEQKNFTLLLKSFALVKKKVEAKLIIIGEGKQRYKLEGLVKELGISNDVAFPGYKDNPTEFIRKSDLFVMSSSWEGFGNVIVEALGVGTSVVSTDCPSGPAEILKNGRYGELVSVNDPESMAIAICKLLNEPLDPKYLISRARDFSVETITDQYLNLIY